MVRFVRLPSPAPEEWGEQLWRTIRDAESLWWLGERDRAYDRLVAEGLPIALAEDAIPDRATVLLPAAGRSPLEDVAWVVDRLLGPGGCPWDQQQTHASLRRHLLEEAYEVIEAIDAEDWDKLREELGDLLMQPVMHAQMEKLQGRFDIHDVARDLVDKLVRRHPHVFGDREVADADEVLRNWDSIKQREKGGSPESILAGVPKAMAALLRAYEVSKRAARVGFEWPDLESVFGKLREEESELRAAIASGQAREIEAEVGDLLFTAVNLARWAGTDPENALRRMLDRFTARFQAMERQAGKPLVELTPEEWDELWNASKRDPALEG
ncbi:MAG: nucleoside triphosphate pyrophosphohydrolase [Fimbriimonadales bacterium]|nr:nucleoside triphosphate pyrophosphohydrolase [Fimbriimonadales bacterium]